ncbi:MAG: glycosyltransferase [Chitinophagaceae bacterium]|nr:MAG: glycosyltransferase [Chitinophagaceae bacterium]
MSNQLHIVCLDAPAPPDYGGAIDMFYKIKALAETGKKIVLHYFDYNSSRNTNGLENFCVEIHAYKRKPLWKTPPLFKPHIVSSRINAKLIARLNKDNDPILLEGLHCGGIIPYVNDQQRIVLRMHNEEAAYYQHLAKTESSPLKQLYFIQESRLLKRQEQMLPKQIKLACLSEADMDVLKTNFGLSNVHFIPCFIPWQTQESKRGKGNFCLYHGNLSVSENEEAAMWLINEVFSQIDIPFSIAGKGISSRLEKTASGHKHIRLIKNPTIDEIDNLIQNAQINVLPSMNHTGVKLKLLNALFNGRFCITNNAGISGSRIQTGLNIAEEKDAWIGMITEIMKHAFTDNHLQERKNLQLLYSNRQNAANLTALWMHCQ